MQQKKGRQPSISTSVPKSRVSQVSFAQRLKYNNKEEEKEEEKKEKEKSDLHRFCQVLGLDYGFGKYLPSVAHLENKDWDEFNPEEKTYMATAMNIGVEHLAGAIYRKDPKALISAKCYKTASESELISLIKDTVITLP
eukprot:14800825-Ditylum_brightwellii.AAC.2